MKIHLHEITDQDTELRFTEEDSWVLKAVRSVDEDSQDPFRPAIRTAAAVNRPIRAQFSIRKVDEVVVISGTVKADIRLICSRCANSFDLECNPSFSALFCKDPVMAGVGHLAQKGKPAGQTGGWARHAHDTSKDLDITYLSQDYFELSDVLSEQLRLQIPFQPLCKQDCRGICTVCGTDLNVGRCACAKIAKDNPFSVLSRMKIP